MASNTTIYQKYRPCSFDSIAGHHNIVEILKKQLELGKIAHSFLFTGQRGTGKTSIARILAKSVNCLNLQAGICCEKCDNCVLSNQQKNPDIIEMDAASNNGVDEIREIKHSVSTLPLNGQFKIYIIDEVHMLTKSAFNALLKTLEEPPQHTIFILATTEYAKIPPTIISRCQIFNFKKIDKSALQHQIKFILQQEGRTTDEEVINELALLCDGSLRDASNMIEQLLNFAPEHISVKDLKMLFYIAPKQEKINLVLNVLQNHPQNIIEYFENAENQGMDFDVFTLSLIELVKEVIEYKFINNTNLFAILELDDMHQFNTIELSALFTLADNLSEAYAKTKGTNISFHYLLISLLKSLQNLDSTTTSNLEPLDQEHKISNTPPSITLTQEPNQIQVKTFKDFTIKEKVPTKESANILCATPTLLKFEIENECLQLENKKTFIVQADEVINVLLKANKHLRESNATKLANIFALDDDGKFIDAQLANQFKPLFQFQIIASSHNEILVRHTDFKKVKYLTFYLLNETFNQQIKELFNKAIIIPINETLWEDVKIQYKKLKTANQLPEYVTKNFEEYYNDKKNEVITNVVDTKTLSAVAHFFDLEDMEIED